MALISSASAASRSARAHDRGVSQADFFVDDLDGSVAGALVFAASELTPEQARDPRGLAVDGVAVTADGEPCAGRFDGSQPTQGDAILVSTRFGCPRGARHYEIVLYYLNELGPGHRTAASISAGDRTTQKLLTAQSRAIAIDRGAPAAEPARPVLSKRKQTALVVVTAVWFASLLGLIGWRFFRNRRRA